MKYDHRVKYNGVWYEPGEEIKEDDNKKSSFDFSSYMAPPENKQYTKTDINRMPVEELRSLAKENGFLDVEENNGAELKKMLIGKFRL